MKRTIRVFVACGVFAVAGCQQENKGRAGDQDRRPRPTGRMEVDQSAVLPVDVRTGVMREYPGATVQDVSKRTMDDRTVRYDVSLTTKDGRKVTQQFDSNGKPSK